MKEAYKGSDIAKAYPKDDGFWVCTIDGRMIQPGVLYIIKETRLTKEFVEVEFEPLRIWTSTL